MTPFQHLKKLKSRSKLSEKKPDELKHARPCTAPGVTQASRKLHWKVYKFQQA